MEFVRVLVEHGANVDAHDGHKSTPLHLMSEGRHVEFARMPIEHGAGVNVQDDQKSTPLHLAPEARGACGIILHSCLLSMARM